MPERFGVLVGEANTAFKKRKAAEESDSDEKEQPLSKQWTALEKGDTAEI